MSALAPPHVLNHHSHPYPTLPPSLLGRIIDFLSTIASKSDLCACALTCHAFLPRARLYLFPSLTVQSPTSLNEYWSTLRTSPALASYVKRLLIRNVERDSQKDWTWPNHVLRLLGPRLEGLKELRMAYSIIDPEETFFISVSLPPFSNVATLVLSGPLYMSSYDFMRMISSFQSLEHLTVNLDGVQWTTPGSTGRDDPMGSGDRGSFKLSLRSLSVRSVDEHLSELVEWIITSPSAQTLHTLWFEFWDEGMLEPVGRLVSACGSVLQDLTLDSCCGAVSGVALGHVDLSLNANIRGLHLPHVDLSDVHAITTLSSLIASTQLSSLSIRFCSSLGSAGDHNIACEDLEKIITSSRFPELRQVDAIWGWMPASDDTNPLPRMFPMLYQRGILKIDGVRPFKCMVKW